ncbi:hypothetical protein ACH4ND_33665, partial [Streptomyces sp. NPDC017179]|uniref:hypothetical protein n=1 Tax=Streptomyces sp. NPDC017179 TaxID=3364979 RepID=UPI0037A3BAC3
DRPVNSVIQPAGRPTTHLSDQGCCNDWLNLSNTRLSRSPPTCSEAGIDASIGTVGDALDCQSSRTGFRKDRVVPADVV